MGKIPSNSDLNIKINELNNLIDANTIIGKPIITNNKTLIPVSKMTIAYLGGNGEYGDVNIFTKNSKPSASGSGAIANVNPSGFLFVDENVVKFIKINDDAIDVVFNKTTEFIQKALNDKN